MPLSERLVQYLPRYEPSARLGSTIAHMATLTVTSTGATDAVGSQAINLSQQTYAVQSVNATTISAFPAGQSNTIAVPAGATWATIVPPAANTSALTLKGVVGDTGIAISASVGTTLSFAQATPASFVITSAGAVPAPGLEIRFL